MPDVQERASVWETLVSVQRAAEVPADAVVAVAVE